MLKLHTYQITCASTAEGEPFIARITTNEKWPLADRQQNVLLIQKSISEFPKGFASCFVLAKDQHFLPNDGLPPNIYILPDEQYFLAEGDVIKFSPSKLGLQTIYRKNSPSNSLLVTERCNNFCLMCSQPPKEADDSYIIKDLLKAIPLMDISTRELGITGGEPTLLGDDLLKILRAIKSHLPYTGIHILSNGRLFKDLSFATEFQKLSHPDLMIGIPIYSDISNIHDYVVQADGAFDDTIRGVINLKRVKQKVEIRVVIHQQTYERLPQLAEFLARNLLFVDHVALMGLEMMGFTKFNLEQLWIDPVDYQKELRAAVQTLHRYKMNVSIYNYQLCLLDPDLWPFNRKSISDWKNEYMPECGPCTKREQCGGFFSSARLRYSQHISPFGD